MKTKLCFIVFVLLPVAKLRPTVAGSTFSSCGLFIPQLRATQPPYGKRRAHNCGTKFCYGQKNENNKAKRGFHTTSFPFYLLFLSILLWNLFGFIKDRWGDRIKKGIYPASDIFLFIVESIGLEPITSTLPVSRSSQMS